jgi:hypothetical protein
MREGESEEGEEREFPIDISPSGIYDGTAF